MGWAVFLGEALGLYWAIFALVMLGWAAANGRVRGVDISTLALVERGGGTFRFRGQVVDPLVWLKDRGLNTARLRLWVDPVADGDGRYGLGYTLALAERAHQAGLGVFLNFHYSAFWADPEHQEKPPAWQGLGYEALVEQVYGYTRTVLLRFGERGVAPTLVQIGNEIEAGLLWPEGKTWGEGSGGFARLIPLLQAGIRAVREVFGKRVGVVLHLSRGGDGSLYRWWLDSALVAGLRLEDFDAVGVSYYPYWHGSLRDLEANLRQIVDRYRKPVLVAETAYPFTLEDADGYPNIASEELARRAGFPPTPEGQVAFLRALKGVVCALPEGYGWGWIYWEPLWLAVPGAGWRRGEGNPWENQALVDFTGELREAPWQVLGTPCEAEEGR